MIQVLNPDEIRKTTQDILSRPEFRQNRTWTDLIYERVVRWLRDLAAWSDANPAMFKVLVVVLTVILAALLIHIVYTVVREFSSLRQPNADAEKRSLRALEGVAENWSEAFRLAKAALEAGNLYRALWITHRILLSALDRMDRVRFARWKTNRDYLRECAQGDGASVMLGEITAAYERVIYAHDDFNRDDVARFLSQVEGLANEASR
jgi:hypothetical protein